MVKSKKPRKTRIEYAAAAAERLKRSVSGGKPTIAEKKKLLTKPKKEDMI